MRNAFRLLVATSFLPLAAHASITYDAVANFSTAHNPNGVWTYAGGSAAAPTTYGYHGTDFGPGYGFSYWADSANNLPAVGQGQNPNPSGTVSVPDTELFLHPGPASTGSDTLVIFKAPVTATYTVSFNFARRDLSENPSGTGVNVSVVENGVTVPYSFTLGTTYGDSYGLSNFTWYLGAGDTVAFDVNNNGDYHNNSTGLTATFVQPTPEPSSLALLGTGVLGVAGFARRKFGRA